MDISQRQKFSAKLNKNGGTKRKEYIEGFTIFFYLD